MRRSARFLKEAPAAWSRISAAVDGIEVKAVDKRFDRNGALKTEIEWHCKYADELCVYDRRAMLGEREKRRS